MAGPVMTRAEALCEARKRWSSGIVWWQWKTDGRRESFNVGPAGSYSSRRPAGTGDSWAAAFADADKRP